VSVGGANTVNRTAAARAFTDVVQCRADTCFPGEEKEIETLVLFGHHCIYVLSLRLNIMCQRFGTFCLFHLLYSSFG
jgi:hypothetical protein